MELSEIPQSIRDRLSAPLFGSFFISWIAFNWETVLILLFSNKVIEAKIYTFQQTELSTGLYLPLISGTVISLLYPAISYIPYWISTTFEGMKLKKAIEESGKRLIDRSEAIDLRDKIDKKSEEIYQLKISREEAEGEIKDQLENKIIELSESKDKVINDLKDKSIKLKSEYSSQMQTNIEQEREKYNSKIDEVIAVHANKFEVLNLELSQHKKDKIELERIIKPLQNFNESFSKALISSSSKDMLIVALVKAIESTNSYLKLKDNELENIDTTSKVLDVYRTLFDHTQISNTPYLKIGKLNEEFKYYNILLETGIAISGVKELNKKKGKSMIILVIPILLTDPGHNIGVKLFE
jgi:hypothetical protein